jgi:hypothetical protein
MSGFEEGVLLAEMREQLRQISHHLQEERKLLQVILERLPAPATYHPVSPTAGSITVRS